MLFYVDDGLLLAISCGEAEDMIQMVIEVAGECGLNLNKVKSNVLLFNHDGIRLEEVGGIRVSNTDIWVQIWEIVECVFISIERERSS